MTAMHRRSSKNLRKKTVSRSDAVAACERRRYRPIREDGRVKHANIPFGQSIGFLKRLKSTGRSSSSKSDTVRMTANGTFHSTAHMPTAALSISRPMAPLLAAILRFSSARHRMRGTDTIRPVRAETAAALAAITAAPITSETQEIDSPAPPRSSGFSPLITSVPITRSPIPEALSAHANPEETIRSSW